MEKSINNIITNDDIQKAKDYKEALDNLKTSVISLNSKLPQFADGIKTGLQAIGEKLPSVVEAMANLNAKNKELAETGQKPKSMLKELAISLFSWNSLVSVGITLLASYSGVIINWVGNMLKGQTTLSALGKAMKDNALITDSITQTRLKAKQSAQTEITDLNTLYRVTQNHAIALSDRKRAANELKEQWPQTFKTLSDETIVTGKAAVAYKNLKEQILASAYAEAYKNKMTVNASRIIDNDQKIINERAKNLTIIKDQQTAKEKLEAAIPNRKDSPLSAALKGTAYDANNLKVLADKLETQNQLRKASDKILYDLNTNTKLLNQENEKYAAGIDGLVKKYDASIITRHKTSNADASNSTNNHLNKQSKSSPKNTRSTEILTAHALTITTTFEQQKQQYDADAAALDDQLSKKLISQEDYNQQSRQLQEKYHQDIGAGVQQFAEKQMTDTLKNLLEAANAERQKQEAITAITKQHEQERKDFALNTAQQVADSAFNILSNNTRAQSDAKIKGLEAQKSAELSNASLTATQKKAIEDKYKQKEAQEKTKAFKAEQRASVLQAVVNGALAITKATAQTGVLAPFVIPGIIASTAIQVATILAQKTPAFAKGGHFVSDGRGAVLPGYSRTDNTNAYLRSGEAVVVSEAMRNPWARNLVSAINVAHGGRDFSVPNMGRGYAIGGVFTDGGNANRYYNQPVNDARDLANTLAYQMINNFPPIYVDVKDVNNQQNILAQTVNRVNL